MEETRSYLESTRATLLVAALVSRRSIVPRRQLATAVAESLRNPAEPLLNRLSLHVLSDRDRSEIENELTAGFSATDGSTLVPAADLELIRQLLTELDDPALREVLEGALRSVMEADELLTRTGPSSAPDDGTPNEQTWEPQSAAAPGSNTPYGNVDEFQTRLGDDLSGNGSRGGKTAEGDAAESRYLVLRPLAQGGLGRVLVAKDLELHREVALKEILPVHSRRADAQYRFLLEAEITGRLEHPGVVPVYGLGRYADGRPYYAMRFISGRSFLDSLKAFHAELSGHAPAGERLTRFHQFIIRFVGVCHTIHFAHTRGVLHRDIKPANIMLGEFGETLVVDWGLAKVLGSDAAPPPSESTGLPEGTNTTIIEPVLTSTGSETRDGSVMGTPAYMSPEQASGDLESITPVSDVYSLGATLYCIVVGHSPFQGKGLSDVIRCVKAGDFAPARTVCRWVPQPLDAIISKAMATCPADRYASARDLADDLDRFLADEPVDALPETWRRRAGRWIRRHRVFVTNAVAALAVVAGVSVLSAVWINGARQREAAAKAKAVQLFAQARNSVDTWMTGVSELVRLYPGAQQTRERLLQEAALAYAGFSEEAPDDVSLRLEQARTLIRLADVQQTLSDHGAAQKTLERARATLQSLSSLSDSPDEWQLEAGRVAARLAFSQAVQGTPSDGNKQFEVATELFAKYRAVHPDSEPLALADATTAVTWAEFLTQQDRLADADQQLDRSRQLFQTVDQGKQRDSAQSGLAQALSLKGQVAERREDWTTALDCFAKALETLVDLRNRTSDVIVLDRLAGTRVRQAAVFRALGREQDEARAYLSAIDDYGQLVAAFPDVPYLRENLALTRVDLAQLLEQNAQSRSAKPHVSDAISELRRLTRAPEPLPSYFSTLAAALSTLGRIERNLGELEPAKQAFLEAADLYKLLVDEYPDIPDYRVRRAVTLSQLARLRRPSEPDQAAILWTTIEESLRPLIERNDPDPRATTVLASALLQQALDDEDAGRTEGVPLKLARAVELLGDGSGTVERFETLVRLLTEAPAPVRNLERALAVSEVALKRWPTSATVLQVASKCQFLQGRWKESERLADQARQRRGFTHPGDLFWQALAVGKQQDRLAEAQGLARQGLAALEAECPSDPDWKSLATEVQQLLAPKPD